MLEEQCRVVQLLSTHTHYIIVYSSIVRVRYMMEGYLQQKLWATAKTKDIYTMALLSLGLCLHLIHI